MFAPAEPLAVAEFEAGVPPRAVTTVLNSEDPPAFKLAALPIPLTVTSLLSVLFVAGVVPVLVLAALKVPLITPFAASRDEVERLNSLSAWVVTCEVVLSSLDWKLSDELVVDAVFKDSESVDVL